MRYENYALAVPASTATGAPQKVEDLVEKYVQIIDAGTACAFSIQGTIDGTNYSDITTSINAAGFYPVPQAVTHVRIKTTTYGSGTPAAAISGRNSRTD